MNPLLQRGNGSSNQATTPTNQLNVATPQVRRTFNRFDNSYKHYSTAYYAEYTPFFVQEMNAADFKRFKSSIQVRTESLKSPLYSGVKMNKDYFFTPYDALLPINWEKIFKNPSQGDDVPSDANMAVADFLPILKGMLDRFMTALRYGINNISVAENVNAAAAALVNVYLGFPLIDAFLSTSGICARMGSPFAHLFRFSIDGKTVSWDRFTEYLFPLLFADGLEFGFRFNTSRSDIDYVFQINSSVDGSSSFITDLFRVPSTAYISPKDALTLFRYYPSCMIGYNDWTEYFTQLRYTDTASVELLTNASLVAVPSFSSLTAQDKVFNYSRMAAYAISCAQFYSNGNVDSVYNAQLYRDMMSSFARNIVANVASFMPTFLYNGVATSFDWLSAHYSKIAFQNVFTNSDSPVGSYSELFYLRSIFDIHNCLKYGDYFTGAHTRPLAVGDVTAPVIGDKVSAIDITKAISYQRFLNVVVKLKNDFKDYLGTIFGTLPAPDYHESKIVSHSEGTVDGFEVANTTSDNQGNLTSLLHNVQEQFEFELEIDQCGVALGVVSFVASRAYSMASDRQIHIADRYDMFNPMLQNIGDQPVLSIEKSGYFGLPFAYHSRFMEYKQRFNVASGAFVDKLRSYCIISDNLFEPSNALEVLAQTLTPAYIRLTPREFDRFFVRNGSWSYGNNYHFICEFDNQSDDVREADYSPSIL